MSQHKHSPGDLRVRKLKWLCRRGMKELDVLLERFIADQQEDIGQGGWSELENLLAGEDDVLWDWIQHPESAGVQYRELLQSISRGTANPD